MGFRPHWTLLWVLLAYWCGLPVCAARAATPAPSFKLTATNVSMGDRSTGTSTFTLTSLNGFTGQVFMTCSGGDTAIDPFGPVLPLCSLDSRVLTVPANGSVSGTAQFIPPASVSASFGQDFRGRPERRPLGMPLTAGVLAGGCLLGSRMKRDCGRKIALMLLGAAGLAGLGSLTACIGKGGLAMTPGSYTYSIEADSSTGALESSADIKVTIHE